MRRRRAAVAAVAMAMAALATPTSGTAAVASADDEPLQAAAKAAAQVPFVGVLEVRWSDGGGQPDHHETLTVQGGGGAVVVKGGTSTNAMASDQERLIEHAGRWDLLSPAGGLGEGRPSLALKYVLSTSAGGLVLNRPTHQIEVRGRDSGALLERLVIDDATGLLLGRDQFDAGAAVPHRSLSFQTITVGGTATPPAQPSTVRDAVPKTISPRRLPDGVIAPATVAGGYTRVGIYQRGDVVQVLYSDGLYDLSLFQQVGRIDHHHVPDARVAFRGESAFRYSWTGNQVLLWEEKGTVYTAISDAPLTQVTTALGSLDMDHGSPAIVRRLRQLCRALVQPLAV